MKIDLNTNELCDIIDCINNRIDDLANCAMFGDAADIERETERMEHLLDKIVNQLNLLNQGSTS